MIKKVRHTLFRTWWVYWACWEMLWWSRMGKEMWALPKSSAQSCQSGRWPSLFQQVQIGKERSTPSETKSLLFKQEQASKRCRAQETCFQAVRTCKEKIQAAQKEEVDNLGGILPQGIWVLDSSRQLLYFQDLSKIFGTPKINSTLKWTPVSDMLGNQSKPFNYIASSCTHVVRHPFWIIWSSAVGEQVCCL